LIISNNYLKQNVNLFVSANSLCCFYTIDIIVCFALSLNDDDKR